MENPTRTMQPKFISTRNGRNIRKSIKKIRSIELIATDVVLCSDIHVTKVTKLTRLKKAIRAKGPIETIYQLHKYF